MKPLHDILLAVWQEVGRHQQVADSIDDLRTLLRRELPLAGLNFRLYEAEHRRLRLIATSADADAIRGPGDVHLMETSAKAVERWLRKRDALHCSADAEAAQDFAGWIDWTAPSVDWIAAPLKGEHGSLGVMIAVASARQPFTAAHAALLTAL